MKFNCLILSALLLFSQSIFSQLVKPTQLPDSLFVESDASDLSYFNYKVNKNQTLYSISKIFKSGLDTLVKINSDIQRTGLRENMILKIPFHKHLLVASDSKKDTCIGVYYKIKQGENLYQLCKRRFDIEQNQLMHLNKLQNSNIQEGTVLFLGYYKYNKSFPVLDESIQEIKPDADETPVDEQKFTSETRGVAISDKDLLGNGRLFALHNSAEMDSEIEIENPVLNKKVYAKVIGRIPPIYEHDIQVIVSTEVARMIGAVDKRFFVSLRYR